MQIIVCKLVHLLLATGSSATKPKPGAVAGTAKMLRHAGRIMKLTAILILGACLQIHATGLGQGITLNEKEAPIETIIKQIQKQTSYKFLYTSQLLAGASPITIVVKSADIRSVLDLVFKNQELEYELSNQIIVIRPKHNKENKISSEVIPTGPIDVTGKVTNNEGQPLAGANVKIQGTNIGVTTDVNGNFVLKNVLENAVLEISFVGHEMKTFTVRKTGFLNIALGQKLSLLDETMVIAYGTTSRRFTTGNVATVKAADIEKQPIQNPLLALQGRVTGVEVTQLTGMPGGGVTVRIQGRNSINSGLEPLIVIDGNPFPSQLQFAGYQEGVVKNGSPLNYINPADIESIDILKDADATAIYGSRAANGAILITTKKGKAGKAKLTIGLQRGAGKVARRVEMMNTQQYLAMRWEAIKNSSLIPSAIPGAATPFLYAPDLLFWDTSRHTDWQKALLGGTAKYTNINAGISGGTTALQYLLGATYNRQTTVFPGNFDNKAGTFHFNINGASSNQRFKIQLTSSYTYDQNYLPGFDLTVNAVLLEPNAPPLYDEDGTLNWAQNAAGNSTWNNPLAYNSVNRQYNNTTKNLVSNVNLNYRILPGLDIRSSFGYTNIVSQIYNPTMLESYKPELRSTSQRTAAYANRNMDSWIVEPQLQYSGKMSQGKIDGLLGTTITKSSFDFTSVIGSGFPTDALMKTLRAATSISTEAATAGMTRFNGLFGRLNYTWKEKYLINFTGRRDGSSKFGDKSKFHNFGSLGIGWIFSQEKWLQKQLPFLSFGKLRSSYGTTGNDQIPEFSYLSTYGITSPTILYQNGISLNVEKIPNPYLQWEETQKFQTGIDLGLIHDKVLLSVTYVNNRSSSQLIPYVLPNITGFSTITKNLPAIISNTSWEFMVNTVNVKARNFRWNSSINLTSARNKLVRFPGIELTSYASGTNGYIVGQPLGVQKVAIFAGLDPATGVYMLLDRKGNPLFSLPTVELNNVVSLLTKFYGGVLNTFNYKGFQLDFLIQFVQKKGQQDMVYYNGAIYPGQFSPGISNQPAGVIESGYWQKPGDRAPIARYFLSSLPSIRLSNAFYSYDASFMRLKNVSLSWQLPTQWLKKMRLQNARLYANAQNLATITNYHGLDPETMSSTSLPPLQMITIGGQVEL